MADQRHGFGAGIPRSRALAILVVGPALLAAPAPVSAQQIGAVIVTGSRIEVFAQDTVPVVHLKRHPDFLIAKAMVESDSRDDDLRDKEIDAMLRALQRRARQVADIELALLKFFETEYDSGECLLPSAVDAVERQSGRRPDTTQVSVVIKTPFEADDTDPMAVYRTIEAFIGSGPASGRATLTLEDDLDFSVVDIAQYRGPLLEGLAADNRRLREALGEGCVTHVSGLEQPVRWRLTGPLELTLYFPCQGAATPRADAAAER